MSSQRVFEVTAFKSILNLKMELGTVNVLIGANGSGKSAILEAFGVMAAAASGYVDDMALQRCGVRPGVPRLYKSAFEEKPSHPHIGFGFHDQEASYAVNLLNRLVDTNVPWRYKTEMLINRQKKCISQGPRTDSDKTYGLAPKVLADLDENEPLRILLERLRNFSIFAPSTQVLRGHPEPYPRSPIGLSGGRLAEAVAEVIAYARKQESVEDLWQDMTALVDWMDEVDVRDTVNGILSGAVPRGQKILRFKDRFMRQGNNLLTGYDASEGALYLLFVAALVLHPQAPKWLAIDNVDQALNPRLVQRMLQLVSEWLPIHAPERCFLLTLQNPSGLDGLPLLNDRVRLFTVSRNNRGHSEVRRVAYTPALAQYAQENNLPLSRLWVMGHLGGVPIV